MTDDITCRQCGATPAKRRDPVVTTTTAYTCSRCVLQPSRLQAGEAPSSARRCAAPGCLGHADERTAEVVCLRCRGHRWVLVRPASAPGPAEYTCQRCRTALAGRPVIDPLVTEASRARTMAARAARNGPGPGDLTGQGPRSPSGGPTDLAPALLIGSRP